MPGHGHSAFGLRQELNVAAFADIPRSTFGVRRSAFGVRRKNENADALAGVGVRGPDDR
jgi:hypothetical protein